MKKFAYSFPILSNKVDQWLEFAKEVNTTRKREFTEMHARIGVTKESWYLQKTTAGYEVLVYTEAKDENFIQKFKNDTSAFSEWFREKVVQYQDINLDSTFSMPQLVLDWSE